MDLQALREVDRGRPSRIVLAHPGRHTFTGESTVLLDRQLTQRWNTFAAYAGDFPRRGGSRHLVHFGTAFTPKPRHQLDFHVGVGLPGGAPDAFVGFGYSILLRQVE